MSLSSRLPSGCRKNTWVAIPSNVAGLPSAFLPCTVHFAAATSVSPSLWVVINSICVRSSHRRESDEEPLDPGQALDHLVGGRQNVASWT